jgi:hypothetical protein
MNKIAMSQSDASTTQQEREIHQIDPTTTKPEEDQRWEHSTEPVGA